jgi:hypothetical protein
MLITYFLNDFEMVPVTPIITGITFVFTFYMRCISIVRSLYFRIFSASFLITFILLLLLLLLSFRTLLHESGPYPFLTFRCVLCSRDIFACYKFNKTLHQYFPPKAWCFHNVCHRHFLVGKFTWVRVNLRVFQSPSDTVGITVLLRCT